MFGIIPRPVHAVLDYLWSIAHFMAPKVVGFVGNDAAVALINARAGSTLAASLLTRYELGVIKVIPFNVHLLLDTLGALMGLASPWLFDYAGDKKARNTTLAFSIMELGVVLLSRRDK